MSIVTLTTDFGTKDYYSARIKGAVLSRAPQSVLVDISHFVPSYNIVQAAFIFKNAWDSFPDGTIHLLTVNDLDAAASRFVLVAWKKHFFIAPDNGLLYLVLGELELPAYLLPWPESHPFPIAEVCSRTVAGLATDSNPANHGTLIPALHQRITFEPVIARNHIRGVVIYIDQFENVVVNIRKTLFAEIRQNRSFALYFKRNEPITRLSEHYSDVPIGETLCWFNSAGFLEIALNKGKAASLLGLKIDDVVQIDFIEPT